MKHSKVYEYRILAENTALGTVYSMHEVELNQHDVPIDYIKLPVSLIHTDLERMVLEIEELLDAFEKPVLSLESFPDMF